MSQLEMELAMPDKPFEYDDYILICAMGAVNDAYETFKGYCDRYESDYQKADSEINPLEYNRVHAIVWGEYMSPAYFTYNWKKETLWTIRWGYNWAKAWFHVEGHGLFKWRSKPTQYIDIKNPPYSTEFMRRMWIADLIVKEVMPNRVFSYDDQDVPDTQLMMEENHCFPHVITVSNLS